MIKNWFLTTLNDIGTICSIMILVFLASISDSFIISCICFTIVYCILDLHVYLSNKLGNKFNIFINNNDYD